MQSSSGNILFENPRFNVGDMIQEICMEDQTSVTITVLRVKRNIKNSYLYDVFCLETAQEHTNLTLKDTPESNYPFLYRKIPDIFQS